MKNSIWWYPDFRMSILKVSWFFIKHSFVNIKNTIFERLYSITIFSFQEITWLENIQNLQDIKCLAIKIPHKTASRITTSSKLEILSENPYENGTIIVGLFKREKVITAGGQNTGGAASQIILRDRQQLCRNVALLLAVKCCNHRRPCLVRTPISLI